MREGSLPPRLWCSRRVLSSSSWGGGSPLFYSGDDRIARTTWVYCTILVMHILRRAGMHRWMHERILQQPTFSAGGSGFDRVSPHWPCMSSRCTLLWSPSCLCASSHLWNCKDWVVWTVARSGWEVWWGSYCWCAGHRGRQPFWGAFQGLGKGEGVGYIKSARFYDIAFSDNLKNMGESDHLSIASDVCLIHFLQAVGIVSRVRFDRSWRWDCKQSLSWRPQENCNSYAKWCEAKDARTLHRASHRVPHTKGPIHSCRTFNDNSFSFWFWYRLRFQVLCTVLRACRSPDTCSGLPVLASGFGWAAARSSLLTVSQVVPYVPWHIPLTKYSLVLFRELIWWGLHTCQLM